MTNRERFLACLHFEPVDRAPFWDFGYWTETPEVWRQQGLPETVTDLDAFFGFDPTRSVPIRSGPIPPFEEGTGGGRRHPGHRRRRRHHPAGE